MLDATLVSVVRRKFIVKLEFIQREQSGVFAFFLLVKRIELLGAW